MPVYKQYNGKPVVGYTASELGYTNPILTEDENNPNKMFWSYQNPDGSRGKPLGLKNINDMLGQFGYEEAKEMRKKSFGQRMAENLVAGGGIGESFKKTLSEKSKARMMGIREAFDPMNIAKKLTGGSRLGPALLGKMMGRSQQDLEYFAGDPRKRKLDQKTTAGFNTETLEKSTECLGNIYDLLKKDRDNKIAQREKKQSFEEAIEKQEELRNQELIKALTARRKKKVPTKKEEEKPAKPEEKPAEAPKPTIPSKPGAKPPAKAPEVAKPPAKAPEVAKPPAKAPEAPKPPAPKPAEAPKPPAPKPKAEPVKEAPKPPPKAEPVKEAPKPPPPKAEPVKPPPTKPPTAAKIPPAVGGAAGKGLVLTALATAGYSKQAQANIMANVEKESNFMPRSEEIPRAEKIFAMFGGPEVSKTKSGKPLNKSGNVIRFPTMEDVKDIIAKGPEAYFNAVYDGRMGNTSPGDGYKYRGRGFIQITGKDLYQRIGKLIGVDLVSDPDLANKPEIAAKIIPAFFQLKIKERKLDIGSLEDIDKTNELVGSADVESRKQRKKLAEQYAAELNTGSQIDQASKENKDLKAESQKDRPANNVNNNTIIQNPGEPPKKKTEKVDDRPAPMKKLQG